MKIVITQSNYIPWKGYFDLINYADKFIFFDEVQYTRRNWRNRNLLNDGKNKKWITLPVNNKGNYNEKISNIVVKDENWVNHHLKIFKHYYSKSEFFNEAYEFLQEVYSKIDSNNLSLINIHIIKSISKYLNLNCKFENSKTINQNKEDASERLVEICKSQKSTIYVTGPSARNYLNEKIFLNNDIKIEWFDYGETKNYKQQSASFIKNLSIVDCIMNCGTDINKFLNLN